MVPKVFEPLKSYCISCAAILGNGMFTVIFGISLADSPWLEELKTIK